jgi:serine/threonine protein kinase
MQWLERFRREARAAGRRFHPNIVAIWDFGDDNGTPFLAMEYVNGRGLDEVIKSSGQFRNEPCRCHHHASAERARVCPRARDRSPRCETLQHHRPAKRRVLTLPISE